MTFNVNPPIKPDRYATHTLKHLRKNQVSNSENDYPLFKRIETQMQKLHSRLTEKSRRLYAEVEALKPTHSGISYIAHVRVIWFCLTSTSLLHFEYFHRPNQIGQSLYAPADAVEITGDDAVRLLTYHHLTVTGMLT